jgi:PKD repeat protein
MRLHRVLAASALLLAACKTRVPQTGDGGRDAPAIDAPAADVPRPLAVDIAVSGCVERDLGEARCFGPAPFTVSFAPVSSPSLTRFVWTFGDGSPPSTERAPSHTYALPGAYDVTVVAAGEVGSVSRTRARFIHAQGVGAGAPCGVDEQCVPGLRCLCGAGEDCGPAFMRGLCTAPCPTGACGADGTCATVDLPVRLPLADADAGTDAAEDPPTDARGQDGATSDAGGGPVALCLSPCGDDAGCPTSSSSAPGLACRALPAGPGGAARWTQACVPPAYHDLGEPCRDASDQLKDRACASGTCAPLGALGVCAAPCGPGAPCPSGSACATFGDGRTMCLRACGAAAPCTRDPLLRCEAPGGAGPLGFQIASPPAGATYCAPRACAAQADCAPAGACAPLGAGGHCVLKKNP